MKIFLDTAHVDSIKQWADTGLIDGVTINPSLLSKEKHDYKTIVKAIHGMLPDVDINLQVTETDPQKVYDQAHAYQSLIKRRPITVKIPAHRNYYPAIRLLAREGIAINATLVFSYLQGLYMSKLGVRYVSPFIGRIEDQGEDGIGLVAQLVSGLAEYETEVLAASIRTVEHMQASALVGAHIATVPAEVLEKSAQTLLTDQGMKKFADDWAKVVKRK